MTDAARHSIYTRFEEILGAEDAEEFMKYLPQAPAADLATKSDIAHLEERFDGLERRFDGLERRFDRFEERLDGLNETTIDQQKFYSRNNIWSVVGSMVGLTAIFSLVVAFLG